MIILITFDFAATKLGLLVCVIVFTIILFVISFDYYFFLVTVFYCFVLSSLGLLLSSKVERLNVLMFGYDIYQSWFTCGRVFFISENNSLDSIICSVATVDT